MIRFNDRGRGLFCGLFLVTLAFSASADEDLPSVLDLQMEYIAQNGGLANMEGLASVLASGKIETPDGVAQKFKLFRKRPNMMRIQVEFDYGTVATVFDGKEGFRELSAYSGQRQISDLTQEETLGLERDSSINGPFFELRGKSEFLKVVGETKVDGVPAYEIEIGERARSIYSRLWLSQENFQELKLQRDFVDEAGTPAVETIYFSDFEKVRDVWIANAIRYEIDGTVTQNIRIDRVRVNVGIFDSYFERPEEP